MASGRGTGFEAISADAWSMLARTDLEASTCWDFPSQSYGHPGAGDARFNGVTPAQCAMNLVRRYTRPGEIVADPMAGSGTIGDVARALGRRAVSFDLVVRRAGIARADARSWPLRNESTALAVIDSPYSDNIDYGADPRGLGRISCRDPRFYEEMSRVASEAHRVLRPGGVLGWIICDEYRRGVYTPVGFRLLAVLARLFEPIDTIALVRHNDRSASPMWEHRARRFNFFLRGFKFLFILRKPRGETGG
ncbi:MAG TPA: DNA methyltransferase [Thermoplasmata archaeon]|nr:DNA methyltransferase [Thermoplasmata archaeon]